MRSDTVPTVRAPDLSVLLPVGADLPMVVPDSARERFEICWGALRGLGFDVEVRKASLRVRHPERGFDRVIHLSGEDDLGEKRALFQDLRAAFGGAVERWLPGLVQSSPTVTIPYLGLKQLVEICQAVRNIRRRHPTSGPAA